MPEKFKSKKTEKAGAAVEEEHLLSMVDIFDDVIIFCGDIEATYVLASIKSINNGFGNVSDKDNITDLEAPTECGEKAEVYELKTSCANEARLSNERHKDHNDDVDSSMSVNDVEVDYEFTTTLHLYKLS